MFHHDGKMSAFACRGSADSAQVINCYALIADTEATAGAGDTTKVVNGPSLKTHLILESCYVKACLSDFPAL